LVHETGRRQVKKLHSLQSFWVSNFLFLKLCNHRKSPLHALSVSTANITLLWSPIHSWTARDRPPWRLHGRF
jgi:hypothetical protein